MSGSALECCRPEGPQQNETRDLRREGVGVAKKPQCNQPKWCLGCFVGNDHHYWLNRKNCCIPEIGFVTVYWPLTTAGTASLVFHSPDVRSPADCSLYPL